MTNRSGSNGEDSEEDLATVRDRLAKRVDTAEGDGTNEESEDEKESTGSDGESGGETTEGTSESGERDRDRGLIVKSAVRERVEEVNVAADFYEALNREVDELVSDAARRAEANGRRTVQPRDL